MSLVQSPLVYVIQSQHIHTSFSLTDAESNKNLAGEHGTTLILLNVESFTVHHENSSLNSSQNSSEIRLVGTGGQFLFFVLVGGGGDFLVGD